MESDRDLMIAEVNVFVLRPHIYNHRQQNTVAVTSSMSLVIVSQVYSNASVVLIR
jgi:hypothetical protein